MVAHSPSRAGDYTPAGPARVAVAADGTVAAVCEPSRITLLALPDGVAFAEIGVDPEALASEVGWLGAPPRLLVLSRYDAYSTAHLLEPRGLRPIAEIRLETPMRLYATVGASALVAGGPGAAVLVASEAHLTAYQFPTRSVPITAGPAAGQFVVALSASIEEWDPQSRMPRRRLRLPRAAAITAVGGNERVVWMTTQQEPARIDVIPLVNRSQPRAHDLPEPIAAIAGHPRSDLVACIGAETGRVYVIDLDGRQRLRILSPDGDGRIESAALVVGRTTCVLAAQAGRAVMIAPLDGRDDELAAARAAPAPGTAAPAGPPPAEPPARSPVEPSPRSPVLPSATPSAAGEPAPRPPAARRSLSLSLDRLAAESSASAAAPVAMPDEDTGSAAAPEPSAETPEPDLPPVPAPVRWADSAAQRPRASSPAPPAGPASGAPQRPASPAESPPSTSARFSAWRDLVRQSQSPAGEPEAGEPEAPEPEAPEFDELLPPAPPTPADPVRPVTAPRADSARPVAVPREDTARPVAVPREDTARPVAVPREDTARPVAEPREDPARPVAEPREDPARPVAAPREDPARPVAEPREDTARPVAVPREDTARPVAVPRENLASWRDEVVAWTRAITAGAIAADAPAAPLVDALIGRFDLSPTLHPVLMLLYGAHLCGERGVAPAEVARVLDHRWDEALGRGELAERGVAEYAGSRVALSPLVLRVLDELPPVTGVLVGRPGAVALLGPCVVVAGDEPLVAVAERCAPQVGGAILVATGEPGRAALVLEARARGAAPMLHATLDAAPGDPAIFVTDDAELAERLGLPRLA